MHTEQTRKTCIWNPKTVYTSHLDGELVDLYESVYSPECNQKTVIDGTVADATGFYYCPFCSKKINKGKYGE